MYSVLIDCVPTTPSAPSAPFARSYVRFYPTEWHGGITMRAALRACLVSVACSTIDFDGEMSVISQSCTECTGTLCTRATCAPGYHTFDSAR